MKPQHPIAREKTIKFRSIRATAMRLQTILMSVLVMASPAASQDVEAVVQALRLKRCTDCELNHADLVHADLSHAILRGSTFQNANLSQANLSHADLSGTNLSFATLQGASLRGADLSGSILYGTDFRDADLTGAKLDPKALDQAHWMGARGVSSLSRSFANVHNAGVKEYKEKNWFKAQQLFSEAILLDPNQPISLVARALCLSQLHQRIEAVNDLERASDLYQQQGDQQNAQQAIKASLELKELTTQNNNKNEAGNGIGSSILSGTVSTVQTLSPALKLLAPLAMKLLIPIGL